MMVHATGTIKFDTWDEQPYDEISRESRLARAVVTNQYCGDIDGHARLEYLMFYSNANTIRFVGLERIVGHIGSKSGGFVLQHVGVFQDSRSESVLSVLPHSGTGGLRDLIGSGSITWIGGRGNPPHYILDYDFESYREELIPVVK